MTEKKPIESLPTSAIEALQKGELQLLRASLREMHPAEIAHLIETLSANERDLAWDAIESDQLGDVLVELTDPVRDSFVKKMGLAELLETTAGLDPDDAADLVGDLPGDRAASLLNALDQQNRSRLEKLLSYPEDTAGSLMTTEAITVRADINLDVVLRYLRQLGSIPEATDKLMVVDRQDLFLGVLPVTSLLTHNPDKQVNEVMEADPVSVSDHMPAQEIANLFEKRDLISAPVVTADGRFVGRITIDDVVDVLRETADQSFMGMAGMNKDEDLFAPVLVSTRRRAVWLGVNLLTAVIASWVISLFDATLEKMVALAILMPVVASMGGNAGSQTLALVIRGLALEQISQRNALRLLRKELRIGALNGLIWAIVIGLVVTYWFDNFMLGIVIGAAMIANLFFAAFAGLAVPIALRRLGIDPAIASSVFLTTVTDIMGFVIFLGLASLVLI